MFRQGSKQKYVQLQRNLLENTHSWKSQTFSGETPKPLNRDLLTGMVTQTARFNQSIDVEDHVKTVDKVII